MRTRRHSTNSGRLRPLLAAVGLAAALLSTARAARAELKVVATVPDLAALAKEVGGDLVSVKAMALPTQDAHFVDAKPSLAIDLNKADLVLRVGLDLELGWLPTLLLGARNPRIQPGARGHLDASQFVHRLEVPAQPIDRSMGDIHPGGNPHYLMDPRAGAAVARGIADRLAELDPAHAATFRSNLAGLLERLEAARKRAEAKMTPFRGVPILQYHNTLAYLADWLGLVEVGSLEPKPGIPPSPAHIAQLLGRARAQKVRALIQEDRYPDGASRLLAEKIPAVLIRIPGGTNVQAGQKYPDYIEDVVNRIATGLAKGAGG